MMSRSHAGRYGPSILAGVVVLILLAVSWPRLLADIALQPGNRVKETFLAAYEVDSDYQLGSGAMATWEQSRRDALGLHASADTWNDLALIAMLRARLAPELQEKRQYYAQGREDLVRALAANPNSGLMWMRLAMIDLNLGKPPDEVLASVMTSIAVAPYEPSVFANRIKLGFFLWDRLDAETRETMLQQLEMMAAAEHWNDIKNLARANPQRIPDMRERLQDNPRALAAVDRGGSLTEAAEN